MALTYRAHSYPKSRASADLLLSAALIASGPVLWVLGTIIVQSDSTTQAFRLADVGSVSEMREGVAELWMSLEHSGIGAVEGVFGLSAALLGLLISLGAVLATTACLAQALAHRRGAFGTAHVLSRLSPKFLQRSAILTLGAGLALSSSAAGSWSMAPDHPAAERQAEDEDMSGLFTPKKDHPNNHRGQGLPQRSPNQAEVVVLPGDTLWDIAADQLGPGATDWEIAESWPRWYAANRERLGEDPGIIHPGTVLSPPTR